MKPEFTPTPTTPAPCEPCCLTFHNASPDGVTRCGVCGKAMRTTPAPEQAGEGEGHG